MINKLVKILVPYKNNPLAFCQDVINMKLISKGQKEVLESFNKYKITVVPSGHSNGKSALAAGLTLHWLSTRYKARVIVTAPTWRQLSTVYYAEVNKWYNKSILKKFDMFLMKNNIMQINIEDLKREWYMLPISPKNPDAIQGQHGDKSLIIEQIMKELGVEVIEDDKTLAEITKLLREGTGEGQEDNIMVIVDEASGVKDEIMEVLEGIDATKTIVFGNMTKTDGFFYEWAYTMKDKTMNVVRLNSEESPFMSREQVESIARRYGIDSNVYRVRVLGLPPDGNNNTAISRQLAESCIGIDPKTRFEGAESIGIDVARFGDDSTDGYKSTGSVIRHVFEYEKKSTLTSIKDIKRWCQGTPNKRHLVSVDTVGVGAGLGDRINELMEEDYKNKDVVGFVKQVPGLELYEINNGSKTVFNPMEYENVITEMFFYCAELLELGEIVMPDDQELIQDLTSREYKFTSTGKLIMESKDEFKKRMKRSPDKGDAFLMTLYMRKYV